MLVTTPGVWLLQWKLRQHPEEEEENSSVGSWYEDKDAQENLALFKAQEGLVFAQRQLEGGSPAMSPRDGNLSAVAQTPGLEDSQAQSNGVCPMCGAAFPPDSNICAECGTEKQEALEDNVVC